MVFCITIALKSFIEFGYRQSVDFKSVSFWWNLDVFWPFIGPLLVHFIIIFIDEFKKITRKLIYIFLYLPASLFFYLELTTDLVTGPPIKTSLGYSYGQPENPIFYYLGISWVAIISFIGIFFLLIFLLKMKDPMKRKQSIFILIGLSLPAVFGFIGELVLPIFMNEFIEVTNNAFALGCIPIGYAIWKYKIFTINPVSAVDNIISTMTDSLILIDPDEKITFINNSGAEILGYRIAEITGMHIGEIFPKFNSKSINKKGNSDFKQLIKKQKIKYIETYFRTKSNSLIPVSLSLSNMYNGKNKQLLGTVCIARDISMRKQKDKELQGYREHLEELVKERTQNLKDTNAKYISLFQNSPVPLLLIDLSLVKEHFIKINKNQIKDFHSYFKNNPYISIKLIKNIKLTDANKAALLFYEADRKKDLITNPSKTFIRETYDSLIDIIVALSEGKDFFETEGTVCTLKGNKKHIFYRISILPSHKKALNQVLISTIDLTERKKSEKEKELLEEQLRQIQKMEAVGTLAGGIAHDFNNLLTGILGYTTITKSKISPVEKTFRNLEIIEKTAMRAADLVKQLLSFARKDKRRNIQFDIHEVINEVIDILKRTIDKRIDLIKRFYNKPLYTIGDPGQIEQVILNLAVNAKDAINKDGEIIFSTDIIFLDESCCKHYPETQPGYFAVINVRDTGQGIPEDILNRIFEPFFTTKEQGKGTGMGLAVAYGIVTNHNGLMKVESKNGEGTEFKIFLPLEKHFVKMENDSKTNEIIKGIGTILIVDDEEVVRNVLTSMLNELGYSINSVANGMEAVEYYKEHGNNIDLIILDMIMPKMDGLDSYIELKKINNDVKAILLTGHIQESQFKSITNEGINAIVTKPFTISNLANVISGVLNA